MRTTAAAAVAQSLACLGETCDGAVCGHPRQKSLEAEGREAEGSRLIVQFGGVDLRIVTPFRGGSTVGMTGTRGGKSARVCTKPFGSAWPWIRFMHGFPRRTGSPFSALPWKAAECTWKEDNARPPRHSLQHVCTTFTKFSTAPTAVFAPHGFWM